MLIDIAGKLWSVEQCYVFGKRVVALDFEIKYSVI
jgi:hypothetical protein